MTETTLDTQEQNQPQKRPVFLTVICILTWVGSGLALLSGLFGIVSSGTARESYRQIANTPGAEDIISSMPPLEEYIFWTNVSNISGVIVAILCIVGALLMFQLKKAGFFLYVGGCVISLVVSVLAMKVLMPSILSGFGIAIVVVGALISAAFIIMYAVNLKHMR